MKKQKSKEQSSVSEVDHEVWIDVTYTCPVRGVVTERVKGIRYKPQQAVQHPKYELEFLKDDDQTDPASDG